MDYTRFDILLNLFDMGRLFDKSLGILAENSNDIQIESSIRQVANTLNNYYESEIFATLEEILADSGTEKSKRICEFQNDFANGFNKAIYEELSKLLESEFYIERSVAERLFHIFEQEGLQSAEGANLLLSVCNKSSVSAPMEAFRYTLRLFEAYPNMYSGEDTPHPGYVYKPSEQRTFECCPICGGSGTPYYRALSYRMSDFSYPHLPVKLWMNCPNCLNLYTWKYPEEHLALTEKHERILPNPANYLTTGQGTTGRSLRIWSDILHALKEYTAGTDLLEVGVGKGELLAVALELGLVVDAVELEPNVARRIADMLNISVWAGDFLAFQPDRTYSIITMGDVIEHVTDPRKALKNAHRLLKDEGVLWLSTPNFESSFSRMMKFQDAMWLEPYHITYFSYSGLKKLAEDCGFRVCEYSVSNRYNGSMELILKKEQ